MRVAVTGSVAFDSVGVVPALPAENATARLSRYEIAPGGAAGNVAMAFARLGGRPALVSTVGPDFEGSRYERDLIDAGVDLAALARTPTATAHAFIFGDEAGNQSTYFFPGASRDLRLAPVIDADHGHFTAGEVSDYPRRMKACGRVSFDPGQETFHRDLAEILECLPLVDVLFANRFELARIAAAAGGSVDRLLDLGISAVIESRGADGVVVHGRDGTSSVAAVAARVVDATGAGDAHRAGFVDALVRGASLEDAARFGAAVASFAVESVGGQSGLPTRAAALERYRKAYREPPDVLT